MESRYCLAVLLTCILQFTSTVTCSGVVMCYFNAGANDRSSKGRFGVSDIPLNLCTHVIYSFVAPAANGDIFIDVTQQTIDNKSSYLSDFSALKKKNKNVKFMVALGGWDPSSTNFTIVVNNSTLRGKLARNIVSFLNTYGLDGMDLDWEYPADRGGVASDKQAFVTLCKEIKAAFKSSGKNYILTAAVGVTQSRIDTSYDVAGINANVDYINLMLYDFHGSWDGVTGVNAPLYAQKTDGSLNLNVNNSVNVWIQNGASPSKLVLGLGSYGKTYTLSSTTDNSTGAAISGAGVAGVYTEAEGTWSFYEICEAQLNETSAWTVTEVINNYVYAQKGTFWVGYDNGNTIYAKARYAATKGLAGIMYWSLDNDDFNGLCNTKYPLIKKGISGYNSVY